MRLRDVVTQALGLPTGAGPAKGSPGYTGADPIFFAIRDGALLDLQQHIQSPACGSIVFVLNNAATMSESSYQVAQTLAPNAFAHPDSSVPQRNSNVWKQIGALGTNYKKLSEQAQAYCSAAMNAAQQMFNLKPGTARRIDIGTPAYQCPAGWFAIGNQEIIWACPNGKQLQKSSDGKCGQCVSSDVIKGIRLPYTTPSRFVAPFSATTRTNPVNQYTTPTSLPFSRRTGI